MMMSKRRTLKKKGETYKSEYERPVRLLEEILEDFCWPEGQQGQNYHRMRWRFPRGKVRGMLVFFNFNVCPILPPF